MDGQILLSTKSVVAMHRYKQTEDQKWEKYPIIKIFVDSATG